MVFVRTVRKIVLRFGRNYDEAQYEEIHNYSFILSKNRKYPIRKKKVSTMVKRWLGNN